MQEPAALPVHSKPVVGRLANRIAIVTGAGSGIGRSISLLYAREGATVVVADLRPGSTAPAEQDASTVELIERQHGKSKAIFVQCDVSSSDSVDFLVAETVKKYGRLDIMVNNAGIAPEALDPQPVFSASSATFAKTLAINVTGSFNGVRAASAQMIQQTPLPDAHGSRGWIVNLASIYGVIAASNSPAYVTSKHAVMGLTKAAALDCAKYTVHVNAICPGYVRSSLTAPVFEAVPEVMKLMEAQHTFKGMGTPDDVAGVALFLASEDSRWMSGSCVEVDGCFSKQ